MAEAARSARSSFQAIKSGAGEMAGETSQGFTNVRASIGLLDNSIRGNHAAAMADLIREFSQTRVVMAALPFAAAAGGILLLGGLVIAAAQKFREWREQQQALADESTKFGTAVDDAFGNINKQILEAQLRSDELRNKHLAALRDEIQLIDHESLDDLRKSFEELEKGADAFFDKLKDSWFTIGIGSDGARHALEQFKTQYEALVAQGKTQEAHGLLTGTVNQAKEVLKLMEEAKKNHDGWDQSPRAGQVLTQLQKLTGRYSYSDKEIQSQKVLVDTLNAQLDIEQRIQQLKEIKTGTAKTTVAHDADARQSAAGKEAADSALRQGQQYVAADKATADARLTITRASIAARLASDIDFANREYALQMAANQAQTAALDKSGKDYANQLKAAQDKALEIESEHDAKLAELKSRASVEQYQKDVTDTEQSQREQIAATAQGSSARLAAIGAAIKAEQSLNLENTSFYRELLTQRAETMREMADAEAKQKADAGKAAAEDAEKSGLLQVAAMKEQFALMDSTQRVSEATRANQEKRVADVITAVRLVGLQMQIEALNKSGNDYNKKLQDLHNQEKQLLQEHENEISAIKEKAQTTQEMQEKTALATMTNTYAQSFLQVLEHHQSFTQMMHRASDTLLSNLIQGAIESKAGLESTKLDQAKAAARWGFNWGSQYGGPLAPVLAPATAATFFAGVMAFQGGTDMVPGVGRGDKIPAMLEPGEGVVPGGVMDGLRNMARSGQMGGQGKTTHVHYRATNHFHALDHTGMEHVLQKHAATIEKHVTRAIRRTNR